MASPGPSRGGVHLHDAADNGAIGEHVEVIVVPLAGRTRSRGVLEDQLLGHVSRKLTRSPPWARASYCCGADLLVPCMKAWISSRVRRPSLFASIALKIRS